MSQPEYYEPQYPTGAPPVSPPPQYNDHPVHQAFNQQFAPPQYYQAPQGAQQSEPKNGFGITALVCGIVGILFCLVPITGPFIGGPLSIVAIIFGAVGAKRARRGVATNKTMALWGLWIGIAACAWAIGDLIYVQYLATQLSNCLNATSNALNNISDQGAQDAANAACQN